MSEVVPLKRKGSSDEQETQKVPKLITDIYLHNLPTSTLYEKSYMHRSEVSHVNISVQTNTFLTASADGVVKFWKKADKGIEFAREIKAHTSKVRSVRVSSDGNKAVSIAENDKSLKVFEVPALDMIDIVRLEYFPQAVECLSPGLVAVAHSNIIEIRSLEENQLVRELKIHLGNVLFISYNSTYGCGVSVDDKGFIEYWDIHSGSFPSVSFQYKTSTDLFELVKQKTSALSLDLCESKFCIWCSDRYIRVFDFLTGKLVQSLDETLETYEELQNTQNSLTRIDRLEFQRKIAIEKELQEFNPKLSFDESERILIYSSYVGVKFVDLKTKTTLKILGKEESERFIQVGVYQGTPLRNTAGESGKGGSSSQGEKQTDPLLVCTALNKNRFYLFSKRKPTDVEMEKHDLGVVRDVVNEKPTEKQTRPTLRAKPSIELPKYGVIRTTLGDIYMQLFPEECPRTIENFAVHAQKGYFDQMVFHRVTKGFMIQTGDPEGNGTGGESIWGGEFEDEVSPNLKHDRPFTVSMANRGPNTNGSQFFITTVPASWLDGRHTLFGRVYKGMDVVLTIESVPVDKTQKPLADVRIIQVETFSDTASN